MCEVSDKLKLCTCNSNIQRLKHYWILYRFINGKNDFVVGQAMLPYSINPEIDKLNSKRILHLLNETNAFDADIKPKVKDRLLISFTVGKTDDERINYGFVFKAGKWKKLGFDPFEWQWNHEEAEQGKIVHALKVNEQ
jgi:hypothetical protein